MEKQKVKGFFKQYLPLIIIIACILAIVGVTLGIYFSNRNIVSQNPPDGEEPVVDPNGEEPVVDPNEEEPVDVVVTWGLPVAGEFTIGMDYSETEFVWSETQKVLKIHKAIDFIVSEGTEVVSVMDGTVESIQTTVMDGTQIVIAHADGVRSVYSSLSSDVAVTVGQSVKKGDTIGYASDIGYAETMEGCHVHFVMTLNGDVVDPHDYIEFEA